MSTEFYKIVKIFLFRKRISARCFCERRSQKTRDIRRIWREFMRMHKFCASRSVCPECKAIRTVNVLPYSVCVIHAMAADTGSCAGSFYSSSITDIDNYMVNLTVFRIKDQITRCCFTHWNLHSILRLCSRCSRKTDPELCIYMLCKTGTVCSVNRIGSTPYIRVTDKLQCIIDQRLTGRILHRCFFHRFECIVAYFIIFRCNFLCRKSTYGFRILSCIGIGFAFSAASSPISRYSLFTNPRTSPDSTYTHSLFLLAST